jgi:hypothetical protein
VTLYRHVPHPWIARRKAQGPVITGKLPSARPAAPVSRNPIIRFNARVALISTAVVGTMWCAYIFALISFSALPSVLREHSIDADVQWIAQTFLQLVLLSVIIVGQNIQAAKAVELARVQAAASDQRADQTFKDAEAILSECLELQKHLQGQDEVLERLITEGDR